MARTAFFSLQLSFYLLPFKRYCKLKKVRFSRSKNREKCANNPYKNKRTGQTDCCTENIKIPMERGDHCRDFGVNIVIIRL